MSPHRQDVPEARVERGDELGVGLPEAVVDEVAEGGAVVGEAHVLRRQVHPLVAVQLDRVLVRRPPENVYAIGGHSHMMPAKSGGSLAKMRRIDRLRECDSEKGRGG